ncbi:tyrosine-type recombinase/integrase [Aeoliella sp. SH292]|uniref:tyrosine-type recombinase/integrase n=1 Tax=Aeoliella sp. SH292 TaxID=3454464 RepID=UPI003F9943F5
MSFANKGRRLPPEPLSSSEVRRLLDACGRGTFVEARNWTLIVLLYRTGLRVSEAIALRCKDVDVRLGTLRVLHGKGDQSRVVGLDPLAARALGEYLATRRVVVGCDEGVLFCTQVGTSLASAYLRQLLPRLAKHAGIDKRVHAHGLRHTHAFELANEGVPIHLIQAQLGHRSLATTDRYVRHLNPTEVVSTVRNRSCQMELKMIS